MMTNVKHLILRVIAIFYPCKNWVIRQYRRLDAFLNPYKASIRYWFVEITWRLLVLLLLYTAMNKLFGFEAYTRQMDKQVFDNRYTPYLTFLIPASEIIVSLLLMIKKTRQIGLWGTIALMTLFTGYVALVTFGYFPNVPCVCASAFEHISWGQHLVFNLFTLSASILAYIWNKKLPKDAFSYPKEIRTKAQYKID